MKMSLTPWHKDMFVSVIELPAEVMSIKDFLALFSTWKSTNIQSSQFPTGDENQFGKKIKLECIIILLFHYDNR